MNAKLLSDWHAFTLTPSNPPGEWDGETYRVESGLAWSYNGTGYSVPRGFLIDGASIPRFYRWRFSPWGKWIRAATVHDWLYRTKEHGLSRKEADQIFRELMKQEGVGWWTRNVMYRAVRFGGWKAWRLNRGTA